jgi:hypothetical protein
VTLSLDTVRTARRILALRKTARRGGDVQRELEPVIEDLLADLDDTMSKAPAAKIVGISVPTLDKWIKRGIVPVVRAPSGRPRIPRDTALDLAERVAELRSRGQDRNLLVAVIDQLQRADPAYQEDFQELYGPGLRALTSQELVSAAPSARFAAED